MRGTAPRAQGHASVSENDAGSLTLGHKSAGIDDDLPQMRKLIRTYLEKEREFREFLSSEIGF
jgi:hypothetical protein